MRSVILSIIVCLGSVSVGFAASSTKYYGASLCAKPGYHCVKIKRGDSWKKLFPNEQQRDLVQRINRTNMRLWVGKTIAVPDKLATLTHHDLAPFPREIRKRKGNLIIVDQEKLAWGAYNAAGKLLKWGAISSGKDYCPDVKRACTTQTGIFYIFNKKDGKCQSNIFPIGRGGAKMPYCMFFYRGFALHGSAEVPGYRDSHGCVRLFTRDAKWLNQNFVVLSTKDNNFKGTKVVVQKLRNLKKKNNDEN